MDKCVLYLILRFSACFGQKILDKKLLLFSALPKPTSTLPKVRRKDESSFWVAGRWKGSLVRKENSSPPYYLFCVREQRLFSWPFALPPPLLPWWWKSSGSHVPAAAGSGEELLWLLSVLSPLWISLRFDRDFLSFREKKNACYFSKFANVLVYKV